MTHTILVIDDDPIVRHTVGRVLAQQGLTLKFAEDGKRGLAMMRAYPPALVITDILMPEKEGLETIMEMRKEHNQPRIIAVSGGGRVGAPEAFLKLAQSLGADETLAKPFEPEQLIAAVKRQLAAKQAAKTPK